MIFPTPKNEKKRLEVLWQYDVLDTVPEKVFDELAELAASICESPVAMITLVDKKRQWFKSKVGTNIKETPRDVSFCAHAILHEDLFIVPDATKDKRFARNPLVVSKPRIRFYAGAPLVSPDGHALGTLCVVDTVPHTLRPDQKRALQILSRHVMTQLELRRRSSELVRAKEERQTILEELQQVRAELTQVRCELEGQSASARKAPVKLKLSRRTSRR
ncbi:MAG: sensor signal transduction histidine kinase [Pedosphaera sp.]|nr:sensor signal transduction histidine kinase [Pedosphaera sp.]